MARRFPGVLRTDQQGSPVSGSHGGRFWHGHQHASLRPHRTGSRHGGATHNLQATACRLSIARVRRGHGACRLSVDIT